MKQSERIIICGHIRYELQEGEHTLSMCDICKEQASRSGECWKCLLKKLEENK